MENFSERHGYIYESSITIREDAPPTFRYALVNLAYKYGFNPKRLRNLICQKLHTIANPNNWTDYPNIDEEVRELINECYWPKVYDVLEDIVRQVQNPPLFEREMNKFFVENGIGWKLLNGEVIYRAPEGVDGILAQAAIATARSQGHPTASNELHEAVQDMSRQPKPDLTGAIQHSIASLECVAREVSGSKETLGKWIKNHPNAFPRPLGDSIEKIWGFASEHGRHLIEAGEPSIDETELVVGLSATLVNYLTKKAKGHPDFQPAKMTKENEINF